jgi:hypothetical protein
MEIKMDEQQYIDARNWIPVKEKSPDLTGYYVVWLSYTKSEQHPHISHWDNVALKWEGIYVDRITHWCNWSPPDLLGFPVIVSDKTPEGMHDPIITFGDMSFYKSRKRKENRNSSD